MIMVNGPQWWLWSTMMIMVHNGDLPRCWQAPTWTIGPNGSIGDPYNWRWSAANVKDTATLSRSNCRSSNTDLSCFYFAKKCKWDFQIWTPFALNFKLLRSIHLNWLQNVSLYNRNDTNRNNLFSKDWIWIWIWICFLFCRKACRTSSVGQIAAGFMKEQIVPLRY